MRVALAAVPWIAAGLALWFAWSTYEQTKEVDRELHQVEWRVRELSVGQLVIDEDVKALRFELEKTRLRRARAQKDVNVCHQRLDDVWWAVTIMAKRTKGAGWGRGQARPPEIPKRERPE